MSYKILLISDIHFGCRSNNEKYTTIIKSFFLDTLKNVIEKNEIKDVRILGDLIDNRNVINIKTLNTILEVFRWYQSHKPSVKFKINLGNHDIYFHNRLDVNSIEILREFPNVEIINTVTTEIINKKKIITFPWLIKDSEAYIKFNEISNKDEIFDLCLGHFEISGFEMTGGILNKNGDNVGKFKNFKQVFTGHFHIRNTKNHISYLGCPYPMDWGDYGDQKGIHIYDIDKETVEFIPNLDSPVFFKITIDDLIKKDSEKISKVKGNFVKLVINKKYDDKIILKCTSILENLNPIVLEIDNMFVEEFNGEDIENVDISKLNNPRSFLDEYIKNLNFIGDYADIDKEKFLEYISNTYESVLKEL